MIDVKKLYEKYKTLDIPNPFTFENIHERLTNVYYGEEVSVNEFWELSRDPHAHFETAVKAYRFRNEKGIQKLLLLNPDEYLDCYKPNGINLIINSEDNEFISGVTEQGMAYLLSIEVNIFAGIDPKIEQLGNPQFEDYLKALYLAGYIDLNEPDLYKQAVDRYRNGFMLHWYGPTTGESTF